MRRMNNLIASFYENKDGMEQRRIYMKTSQESSDGKTTAISEEFLFRSATISDGENTLCSFKDCSFTNAPSGSNTYGYQVLTQDEVNKINELKPTEIYGIRLANDRDLSFENLIINIGSNKYIYDGANETYLLEGTFASLTYGTTAGQLYFEPIDSKQFIYFKG